MNENDKISQVRPHVVSVQVRVAIHTWTQAPACQTEQQQESTHPKSNSDQPTVVDYMSGLTPKRQSIELDGMHE